MKSPSILAIFIRISSLNFMLKNSISKSNKKVQECFYKFYTCLNPPISFIHIKVGESCAEDLKIKILYFVFLNISFGNAA